MRSILTRDAVERMRHNLNLAFREVHEKPSAPTGDEADWRFAIIKNTFSEMAVVALTYLYVRDRAAFRAIFHSGLRYAEEKFSNADARFVLRRPEPHELFLDRMHNIHLLGLYEAIKCQLSEAWRTVPPAGEPLGSERFVSHKNRFDERKLRGTRRRWMEIDRRAEVVCAAASGLFLGELISQKRLTQQSARTWVTREKRAWLCRDPVGIRDVGPSGPSSRSRRGRPYVPHSTVPHSTPFH